MRSLIEDDIQILLIASDLKDENAYELATDLVKYYPSAALYFIEDSNTTRRWLQIAVHWDIFVAPFLRMNSKRPCPVFLQFDELNSPTITPVSQLNFSEDFDFGTDQHMYEQLEQLLKVQLLTMSTLGRSFGKSLKRWFRDLSDSDQK